MNTTRPRYKGTENCAGSDAAAFFLDGGGRYSEAEETCEGCPMLEPCFEYALTSEEHGFWGGTSAKDRDEVRRRLGVPVISNIMIMGDFRPPDSPRAIGVVNGAEERRDDWHRIPLERALAEMEVVRARNPRFGRPRLSEEDVRSIRLLLPYCRDREIADAYQVTPVTVQDIRSGRTWVSVA